MEPLPKFLGKTSYILPHGFTTRVRQWSSLIMMKANKSRRETRAEKRDLRLKKDESKTVGDVVVVVNVVLGSFDFPMF